MLLKVDMYMFCKSAGQVLRLHSSGRSKMVFNLVFLFKVKASYEKPMAVDQKTYQRIHVILQI